jgi:hypothetical protein
MKLGQNACIGNCSDGFDGSSERSRAIMALLLYYVADLKMASVQSCNEALIFHEHGKESVAEWARSRKDGLVIDCDSIKRLITCIKI